MRGVGASAPTKLRSKERALAPEVKMGRLSHRTAPACTYFVTTKTWQSRPPSAFPRWPTLSRDASSPAATKVPISCTSLLSAKPPSLALDAKRYDNAGKGAAIDQRRQLARGSQGPGSHHANLAARIS